MAIDPPKGEEPVPHAPAGTTMEELLKVTGVPVIGQDGELYYQLGHPVGSVKVRADLFDDFKTAETYLGQGKGPDGKCQEAIDLLYNMENPPKRDSGHWYVSDKYPPPIEIRPTDTAKNNAFNFSDPEHPSISWAPKGGFYNGTNPDGTPNVLSPAMGLLHESGHAVEWQQHEQRIYEQAKGYPAESPEAAVWDDPEERRNIEGLEHRVGAEHPGEGSRNNHHVDHDPDYKTRGPASLEPEPPHQRYGRHGAAQAGAHVNDDAVRWEPPGVAPKPPDQFTLEHEAQRSVARGTEFKPMAVTLNGQERGGGVITGGQLTGPAVVEDDVVTIRYTVGGRPQTLQAPTPGELDDLGTLGKNDTFKLQTDAKGQNAALTVESQTPERNFDHRLGPDAAKTFGEAGTRSITPRETADKGPALR
jgi:hypothetical protein